MFKNNLIKTVFFVLFFIIIFFIIQRYFFSSTKNTKDLQTIVVFKDDKQMESFHTDINNILKQHPSYYVNNEKSLLETEIKELIQKKFCYYFHLFKLYITDNKPPIMVSQLRDISLLSPINISFDQKNHQLNEIKIANSKISIYTTDLNNSDFSFNYLCFNKNYFDSKFSNKANKEKLITKEQERIVQDFFTVLVGTNKEHFVINSKNPSKITSTFFQNNFSSKEKSPFQLLNSKNLKTSLEIDNIFLKETFESGANPINSEKYNHIIKNFKNTTLLDKDNNFFLELQFKDKRHPSLFFQIFVNEFGSSPIQWSSKLNWSGALGFYYIWNTLIIVIGFFLYIFSLLLGNFGFGIILTTIIIRTLSWPIYTKTSTFSLNMGLAQPEIEKIQKKYVLKKDSASTQKMQLEILKIYKKYNISFLSVFVSFLQMPIFISMLTTLKRFRISGGIFDLNNSILTNTKFLGFIDLSNENFNDDFFSILTKCFLSIMVGLTMLILNKISFQKTSYLKSKSDNDLSLEEKIQKEQKEKSFRIVSYFMIIIMVFAAFKDNVLSIYWIVGNTYTIFQTIVNRSKMTKKYNLLKSQY